ncbi:glycosyltransferase family 2 protein [Nostoc piscinale]|uniref:glycosyltransferase family 2 protein n=1 Tax=Nostoc piscinale TaxID=224012 RepID=UPI000781696B|nr:glycosyltransferase [Nostoc piscinale]
MPKVSVIIPTYQRSHLVGQAIESVLAQTYCNYEIIVVNDGSTDNTEEILAQYADQVIAIHQDNRGTAAARNAGIRVSQGQYLAFLDDDDLWEPQKLEKQIPLLETDSSIGLVYTDMVIFNEAGILPGTYLNGFVPPQTVTPLTLLHGNFFPMPTIIIRRVCWEQLGGFDESLRSSEDYDLWLRIVEEWAVGYVNEPLARYCRHSENSKQLSQNTETMLLTTLCVKEAAFQRNPYLQRLQPKYRDSCLRPEYLELANFYTQNGDLAKAKAVLDRYQPDKSVKELNT